MRSPVAACCFLFTCGTCLLPACRAFAPGSGPAVGAVAARAVAESTTHGARVAPLSETVTGGAAKSGSSLLQASATTSNPAMQLALENARRLSEGDLSRVKVVTGEGDAARRSNLLEVAYQESERITGIYAKTFYLGTKFMGDRMRQRALWAIYVWCRRTDDIVDGPRGLLRGRKSMQADLEDWTDRLEEVWRGQPRDALDLALVDVRQRFPSLPIRPFRDMIGGMVMDVPGMGKNRYETFEELEEYCYRVAGTVGLMTLPILGTSEGVTEEEAKGPALSLGIALQLTNILRDVGEDAQRGRIYLPMEDLRKFNVPEAHILNGVLDDNYRALMKFQIERARYYYARAAEGVPMLAPESRLPVQASLDMYGQIMRKIEENNYDNFRKRAYVSKTEKLLTLPSSWLTSLKPEAAAEAMKRKMESPGWAQFSAKATRFDLLPENTTLVASMSNPSSSE